MKYINNLQIFRNNINVLIFSRNELSNFSIVYIVRFEISFWSQCKNAYVIFSRCLKSINILSMYIFRTICSNKISICCLKYTLYCLN